MNSRRVKIVGLITLYFYYLTKIFINYLIKLVSRQKKYVLITVHIFYKFSLDKNNQKLNTKSFLFYLIFKF